MHTLHATVIFCYFHCLVVVSNWRVERFYATSVLWVEETMVFCGCVCMVFPAEGGAEGAFGPRQAAEAT
jgi:hypothetical protein